MKLFITEIIVIFWLVLEVHSDKCERDKSRTVRKIIQKELLPIYKDLGVKIPYKCPFFKDRDRYIAHEDHKERESVNKWSCGYCGKAFIGEIYLDSHFDNRHSNTIYKEPDSVCLADFCEIFRCDVVSGVARATFWDVALCMEEDMKDLTQDCTELLSTCIPDSLVWNTTNKLKSGLSEAVCSYLTCSKYWDTPLTTEEETPPTAYIVLTVLLIVVLVIYYCVAVNYFLTDTFSDMYDSDEYVGKNPESVMDSETVHTPKKIKHRTRPKTIIDTESFISQDRPRRSLGTGRDRHSKRRHLETNEDVFSIRRSYENVEDVHMSGSDGHSYGDSDRNVEIDIKETDYR